eukprot:scaffold3311_cov411-Prasinococcus_capsulatus_cf.AAC.2
MRTANQSRALASAVIMPPTAGSRLTRSRPPLLLLSLFRQCCLLCFHSGKVILIYLLGPLCVTLPVTGEDDGLALRSATGEQLRNDMLRVACGRQA